MDRASDKDDPHWEWVISDWYDEETDSWPSIMQVFAALGVTEDEFRDATGADNFDWPTPPLQTDMEKDDG